MENLVPGVEEKTLKQIAGIIEQEKTTGHIPQPMFIVGSSGSGKSSLVQMLIPRLLKDENLTDVQRFDGKNFFRSSDVIRAIEGEGFDITKIPSEQSLKRKVVVIEDIDFFFNRTTFDDQYLFRSYLNRESAPLLIATLSEINSSLADYRAPFFEGVRLIFMPVLKGSALADLEVPEDTRKRIAALLEFLPPVARSYKVASAIIALSEDEASDFRELVGFMEPQLRSKYESLPIYSQKILSVLAMSSEPMTLSGIRESTNLPNGTISTYLRLLIKSGIVKKSNPDKRGAPYEISDQLFKRWLSGGY